MEVQLIKWGKIQQIFVAFFVVVSFATKFHWKWFEFSWFSVFCWKGKSKHLAVASLMRFSDNPSARIIWNRGEKSFWKSKHWLVHPHCHLFRMTFFRNISLSSSCSTFGCAELFYREKTFNKSVKIEICQWLGKTDETVF